MERVAIKNQRNLTETVVRDMYIILQLTKLFFKNVVISATDGAFGPNMSHVDFVPNTAHPQPTTPLDFSKEEFLSMDDIQTSTLPRSQIGVVMTSYDKSIGKYFCDIYFTAL